MTELEEKSNLANIKYVGNRLKILGYIILFITLCFLVFYFIDPNRKNSDLNALLCSGLGGATSLIIIQVNKLCKKDWSLKNDYKYYYICYIQEVARKENEKIEREKWTKHVKRIP